MRSNIPSSEMEFGQTLWVLASYTSICIPSLWFAWVFYYNFTRTHVPAPIEKPAVIRLGTFLLTIFLGLAVFLEKLGICHRYRIWRVLIDGIPPMNNPNLIIKDLVFDEVPVRIYCPKKPTTSKRRAMIYIHGGVCVFGSIKAYERICRAFAEQSDSVVLSVGFRLSPEHPKEDTISDCRRITVHFLKNAKEYGVDPDRISIGGDSSGATISVSMCHFLLTRPDLPRLRALVLIYPFLQAVDFNLPSYQQNHSIPILFKKRAIMLGFLFLTGKYVDSEGIMKNAHVPEDLRVKYRKWISADLIPEEFKVRGYAPLQSAPFSEELYEEVKEAFEPMLTPLLAEDAVICQLPETFILTCEFDVVRDDGLLYKKRLEDNGVPVTWHHLHDGFHGILFLMGQGPLEFRSTRRCVQKITNFLKSL